MSHQDWEPVVIHGKNTSSHVHKSTAPQNASGTKHLKEIAESNDIGKLKELSSQDRQTMISMRAAKGLKQDQLAQAIAMPASVYKNIESGKAIPTQQQLSKINFYLKTNLKLS